MRTGKFWTNMHVFQLLMDRRSVLHCTCTYTIGNIKCIWTFFYDWWHLNNSQKYCCYIYHHWNLLMCLCVAVFMTGTNVLAIKQGTLNYESTGSTNIIKNSKLVCFRQTFTMGNGRPSMTIRKTNVSLRKDIFQIIIFNICFNHVVLVQWAIYNNK